MMSKNDKNATRSGHCERSAAIQPLKSSGLPRRCAPRNDCFFWLRLVRLGRKSMKKFLYFRLLLPLGGNAQAALNVFACEPEWAALTQQLAGDQASIYTATGALQDPHRVEARPSLIAKARRADLVVCTGAELEVAWLPVVLRESGNRAVQPGGSGYFEAASAVRMLEVPARLDRAEGDVHALGNPHIQTDERNFLPVAEALANRLMQIDPANAAHYRQRLADFSRQWAAAIAK